MIEAIKELRPELGAELFVLPELRVLEESKIKVLHAVGAYVWFRARIGEGIADGEVSWVAFCEYSSVEPASQPLIQRTGG